MSEGEDVDEIVWIRPSDFDPTVQPGIYFQPEPSLPNFKVLSRRQIVMMFNVEGVWRVQPFTQLTLAIAEMKENPSQVVDSVLS